MTWSPENKSFQRGPAPHLGEQNAIQESKNPHPPSLLPLDHTRFFCPCMKLQFFLISWASTSEGSGITTNFCEIHLHVFLLLVYLESLITGVPAMNLVTAQRPLLSCKDQGAEFQVLCLPRGRQGRALGGAFYQVPHALWLACICLEQWIRFCRSRHYRVAGNSSSCLRICRSHLASPSEDTQVPRV